jgi:predicted amidophosphoribosyltransferase
MPSLVSRSRNVKRPESQVRVCSYCGKRLREWEWELCPTCRRRLAIPLVGPCRQ